MCIYIYTHVCQHNNNQSHEDGSRTTSRNVTDIEEQTAPKNTAV